MSQMVTITAWCVVIVLGILRPAISKEPGRTLSAETQSATLASVPASAVPASPDASRFSDDTTKDSMARAAKARDSTVHAMLAALEHDASLKALAREESELPEKPGRSVSGRIAETIELLQLKAMRHRWFLFAAAAAAVLLTGALILAARGRSNRESRRFMTTTRLSLMNSEVQRACLYIEKNYFSPGLSPSVVCAAIITGVPFLETVFEKELGMSIGAYINQVRIHRAKLMVNKTPEMISSVIAEQVGFSDAATFEEQFKLVAGTDFAVFCQEKQAAS